MNQYFLYKNYKKNLKFKNIRSFCKAILKSIGSVCYTWTKSYIYNINNNFHDPSLSEFSCNIKSGALNISMSARSCYKNVIIKKKKN